MTKTYPVVEVFGPTVQGEGPSVGERVWFVRLGGCDYRCSWCDTMYAVTPSEVRKAPKLTVDEIVTALYDNHYERRGIIVLSGGNPVLHELGPLLDALPDARWQVETQGTMFRDWLHHCDLVVVSPKPPSALGEEKALAGIHKAREFVAKLRSTWALKFVAFDDRDLQFALDCRAACVEVLDPHVRFFWRGSWLSAGTTQQGDLVANVVDRYRWLANEHTRRRELGAFKIGLQAHVLAWPGEMGK